MAKRDLLLLAVVIPGVALGLHYWQPLTAGLRQAAWNPAGAKTLYDTMPGVSAAAERPISKGPPTAISDREAEKIIADAMNKVHATGPLKTVSFYTGATAKRMDVHYYHKSPGGPWLERFETSLSAQRPAASNPGKIPLAMTRLTMITTAEGVWALAHDVAIKYVALNLDIGYRPAGGRERGASADDLSATREPIEFHGKPCTRITRPLAQDLQEAGRKAAGRLIASATQAEAGQAPPDSRAWDEMLPALQEVVIDDEYGLVVSHKFSTKSGRVVSNTHVDTIERLPALDLSTFAIPERSQRLFPQTTEEYSRMLKRAIAMDSASVPAVQ